MMRFLMRSGYTKDFFYPPSAYLKKCLNNLFKRPLYSKFTIIFFSPFFGIVFRVLNLRKK